MKGVTGRPCRSLFRQADACVVGRNSYETMVELNPQVGRELKVVASSHPLSDRRGLPEKRLLPCEQGNDRRDAPGPPAASRRDSRIMAKALPHQPARAVQAGIPQDRGGAAQRTPRPQQGRRRRDERSPK
ncbi:MAG: phosphate/phosphite/phosphonate ABC transporter substrate-binding protein [Desulfobacterales bacterium]|nr:phosphate/phosphite/phosphonate ABC transporter substrate-binding protein [Desulfobacterales bacterium]